MNKVLGRSAFALLAVAVLVTLFEPGPLEAQGTCAGSCTTCSGGGHSYGTAGEAAMGLDYHGCGGATECGNGANLHNACDGDASLPEYMQMLIDSGKLLDHQTLTGQELYEIVARSDGRVFINWERGAVQQRACDDPESIIAHRPLAAEQIAGYQMAEQEDQQDV